MKLTVKEALDINDDPAENRVIIGIKSIEATAEIFAVERYSENGNGWWAGDRLIFDVVDSADCSHDA